MILPPRTVGIDAGATLCKLVFRGERLETARFPARDLAAARERIAAWAPRRVGATGGGAEEVGEEVAGAPVRRVPEFAAWARGAPVLAAEAGMELPAEYLLVSLGTGTSILVVRGDEAERVGGSALGGGTLLGLGRLLVGAESFEEILALAATGDRRGVDLLVGDIYRRGGIALPADLNAASFGKLESTRREDLAHALLSLIGENLGTICTALGRVAGVATVVYGGSTLEENRALEAALTFATERFGGRPLYLPRGAFCGAAGAARLAVRDDTG